MRQEMMGFWDGSGISWTCEQSAPHFKQFLIIIFNNFNRNITVVNLTSLGVNKNKKAKLLAGRLC